MATITSNLQIIGVAVLRIAVAATLGGFIGWEREHVSRPAGLRTHILVCAGSALVMLTSQYINELYGGTLDPTRMGAQVISGIGFLGAGTIIKEGLNVRGLTTAASLWAISSVGIAVGAGFYTGALVTTIIMFLVLEFVKKLMRRRMQSRDIYITAASLDRSLSSVCAILQSCNVAIVNSEISAPGGDEPTSLRMRVIVPKEYSLFVTAIERIRFADTVSGVHIE